MTENITFCERYLCETSEETCNKCKNDVNFRMALVEQRQKKLESFVMPAHSPCSFRGRAFSVERKCCGGQTQNVEHIECKLYGDVRESSRCLACRSEKTINIACSSKGIGDSLCALYVCAGMKKKHTGSKIRFFTHYPQWTQFASDIESIPFDRSCMAGSFTDVFHDYGGELSTQDTTRKDWYAKVLAIKPERPQISIPNIERQFYNPGAPYVVLAPFSAWQNRSWPIGYWLYLECLIKEKLGMHTLILDGPGDGGRTSIFQGFRIWGHSPEVVCNLLKHAEITIANDSMISHLGGLIDAKTLAIVSHFEPEHLFSYTNIKSIVPNVVCAGCKFQYDRGYRNGCDHQCFALSSITPIDVFSAMCQEIEP